MTQASLDVETSATGTAFSGLTTAVVAVTSDEREVRLTIARDDVVLLSVPFSPSLLAELHADEPRLLEYLRRSVLGEAERHGVERYTQGTVWIEFRLTATWVRALPWDRVLRDLFDEPVYRRSQHAVRPVGNLDDTHFLVYADQGNPRSEEILAQLAWEMRFVGEGNRPALSFVVDPAWSGTRVFDEQVRRHSAGPAESWAADCRDAAGDRAVDVLVVVGDPVLLGDDPVLRIGDTAHGERGIRIGPGELAALARELGAWSIAVLGTSGGTTACAQIADGLARACAGPVVGADSARQVANTYRRLLSSNPHRFRGRRDDVYAGSSESVYVHPDGAAFGLGAVASDSGGGAEVRGARLREALLRFTLFEPAGDQLSTGRAPTWVAATQRWLEQWAEPLLRNDTDTDTDADTHVDAAAATGYARGLRGVAAAFGAEVSR